MAGCSRCGGKSASLQARLQNSSRATPTNPNTYGRVAAPAGAVRKPLMQRIADTVKKDGKK